MPPQPVPIDDILRRQAEGFDAANARADAYSSRIAAAATRVETLRAAVESPAWKRWAAQLDSQAAALERLSAAARNRAYAESMATGQAARHAQAMTRLNREHQLQQQVVRNAAGAADLASGAYMRYARSVAEVEREHDRLNRIQNVQDNVARRGVAGGFARSAAPELAVLGGAGLMAGNRIMSSVRSGFAGTNEMVAFEYQFQRLNRQLAAIAIPAFQKVGEVVGKVAAWFEQLTGPQQDMLLKVGLVVVGFGVLGKAIGGAAVTAWALSSAFSKLLLAVNASSVASARHAAVTTTSTAATGLGTAAAVGGGVAAGGLVSGGARAGLATAGRFAAAAALPAAIPLMFAMYASAPDEPDRRVRTIAESEPGLAGMTPAELREEARRARASESSFEHLMRRTVGRVGAGMWDFAADITGSTARRDDWRPRSVALEDMATAREAAGRRDVTPFGNQLLEAGGTAQLIQEEVLRATVARAADDERAAASARALAESLDGLAASARRLDGFMGVRVDTSGFEGMADRMRRIAEGS